MDVKTKIIGYPGRFQIFGPHHKKSYDYLCKQFGQSNVYIITSDKTGVDSPWSFIEKREMMLRYGIPAKNIILEKNPYKPEFINNFDASETCLLIAYGEKDYGRLSFFKKDGTPGYYQPYRDDINLNGFDVNGYAIQLPHISIKYNGQEISGTYLREFLKVCDEREFKKMFGFFDASIYAMLKNRVINDIVENSILRNNLISEDLIIEHYYRQLIEKVLHINKSYGIPRINMPQVEDVKHFSNWLKYQGFSGVFKSIPAESLKFTQNEIESDKVANIVKNKAFRDTNPIITSNDYYILDGHHRVAAIKAYDSKMKIAALHVNIPIKQLLQIIKTYPEVKYKDISELNK